MTSLNDPPRDKRSGTTSSSCPQSSTVARSTPIINSSDMPCFNVSSLNGRSSPSSSGNSNNKQSTSSKTNANSRKDVTSTLTHDLSNLNLRNKRCFEISSSDSENESLYVKKKRKLIIQRGPSWKFIKPKNKGSLFFQIICSKNDMESLAMQWYRNYTANSEKAVFELLQLFIDITGKQTFFIGQELTEKNKIKEAVKKLENLILLTNFEKYYICNTKNPGCTQCLENINTFLRYVWIISHERRFFYDYIMTSKIGELLKEMALSDVKVIRHTGVYFAAQLLLFTSEIDKMLLKEEVDDENLKEWQLFLTKFEKYLLYLVNKNCRLPCDSLFRMKIQCLEVIRICFKTIPHITFEEKSFDSFLTTIEDQKPKVRQKAVEVAKYLVKTKKFSQFLTPLFQVLLPFVESRLLDIDYDVSINAVQFFTSLHENYLEYVSEKVSQTIIMFVFHKNYPLACAAGQFMTNYFRKLNYDEVSIRQQCMVISEFVKLCRIRKFYDRMPLLVESTIDYCEELKNFDLIVKVLLEQEFDSEEEQIWCCLLSQVVIQSITGKSPMPREKSRNKNPNELQNQRIVQFFIPKFYNLMKKISKDSTCCKSLCNMLLVFDFEEYTTTQHHQELDKLMKFLRTVFVRNADEDVLDILSKIFSVLLSPNSFIKVQASKYFTTIFEESAEKFRTDLEEYSEEEKQCSDLNLSSLRLETLFRYNNLTRFIDWNSLFISWDLNADDLSIQIVQRIMKCCYWFLIWEARDLKGATTVTNDNLERKIEQLSSKCKHFISQCLSMMNENPENKTILQTSFEVVCDIHLGLIKELHSKFQENELFKLLLIKITDIRHQNILVDHVVLHCFGDNDKTTIKIRRLHLSKLLNMFVEDIIPFDAHFMKIFKYYAEFNVYFEDIFNSTLQILQNFGNNAVICYIAFKTIIYSYNDYLTYSERFDSNSSEVEKMKALANQFLEYIKRKVGVDYILKMLENVIKYSFISDENRKILCIFSSYTSILKLEDRKILSELLKQSVPKDDKQATEIYDNFILSLSFRKGTKPFIDDSKTDLEEEETEEEESIIEEIISD